MYISVATLLSAITQKGFYIDVKHEEKKKKKKGGRVGRQNILQAMYRRVDVESTIHTRTNHKILIS